MSHSLSITFIASGESTWICCNKSPSSNGFLKNPEFILDCTFCKDIYQPGANHLEGSMNFFNKDLKNGSDFRCQEILAPDIVDVEIRTIQSMYSQDWDRQKREDISRDLPILN